MEQRDEGYLPPEPSGPEPEVGGGGQQQQPQQQPPPAPPPGYQPPPAPGYTPPYGYQQQQPGYPPPAAPGYSPPYGYPAQQGYFYTPPPPQPGNGPAVASLVVSCVSAFLCLTSAGLLSPLTLPGAIVGMVLSRNGKRKIEAGETTKHKDLATAGWWVGIAALVLSVISIIAWVVLIVVAANSDSSSSGSSDPFQNAEPSSLGLGVAAVRIAVGFVC